MRFEYESQKMVFQNLTHGLPTLRRDASDSKICAALESNLGLGRSRVLPLDQQRTFNRRIR